MSRGLLRGGGRQLELHGVAARQLCPRDIKQRRYRLRRRYIYSFHWGIELRRSCGRDVFDQHWHSAVPQGLFFGGSRGGGLHSGVHRNLCFRRGINCAGPLSHRHFFGSRGSRRVHFRATGRFCPSGGRPRLNPNCSRGIQCVFRCIRVHELPHWILLSQR